MNTTDFLRRIWPASGLYVIARLVGKKWKHQVCSTVEEASAYALDFDRQGVPTYHACASYREALVSTTRPDGEVWHQVRTHANVKALKCFYMDLDVKPGNPAAFESQEQAIDALVTFCEATKLPIPMVVSSGGGIHTYWVLENDILPETWRPVAEGLKRIAAGMGFHSDPAVSADPARVLRPVGTWNRKDPNNPRLVELIADSNLIAFPTFKIQVDKALKAQGVKAPEGVRKTTGAVEEINAAFSIQQSFPPCSGIKVADRCAQLAKMRDTKGCVSEPLWYAGIQLLCHTIEGDELIHQWSNGHANYSIEETNQKISQVRSQQLGPTLCATFASRNPGGCDGCPFSGKISSPAQLGTHIPSAPAPTIQVTVGEVTTTVALPAPPLPFTRGEEGGIYIEEEGITHKIYNYDCYPIELAYDEQLGYETMRWRHWLPKEGWKECTLRSALLARPVDFESSLRDNHIQPLIRNKMAMYGDAYIRQLRLDTKMRQLFKSQGWKNDDTDFVLGDKLYRKGEVIQAGFSQGTHEFLKPFHSKGTLETWKGLTWVLDTPGFEPHAFMLLLAFASPLLKLAGRDGFTVNALGDTGAGKSTMARFMSSVYGHPTAAWIARKDTALARVQRFGAHFSLPVYMDEATTIPNKDLRDLVYEIPTGKSRTSMRQDYTMRPGAEWSTIFVTTTNDSLQAKLQQEKANAEAESLRLFEFKFPRVAAFGPISKMIPPILAENYGVAGISYVRGLVENREAVKARLADIVQETETSLGMEDKERFWSQAVALSLYGGHLAREWGIIDFDPTRLKPWLRNETQRMRKNLGESYVGSVGVLADFLNEHVGERLTITTLNATMVISNVRPMHQLSQRYEKDTHLLYIWRKRVLDYLRKGHFNENDIRDDLMTRGILVSDNAKKTLGTGTDLAGAPSTCWLIRADHPEVVGLVD